MQHFLAYGNSDQASFRHPDVRDAFDFMLVPGTIAAYYPDATAAFVLSSELDYVIEPRTPLFQGRIPEPKASHYSLANHLGSTVHALMGDPEERRSVTFSREVYTDQAIQELVEGVISFQRDYGGRAPEIADRLARYRQLLAEALHTPMTSEAVREARGPNFVLAPYFAVDSMSDPWWEVSLGVWEACGGVDDPTGISPVVAVGDAELLSSVLEHAPKDMAETCFFWITGFNERTASEQELSALTRAVTTNAEGRSLINLYGGFFSVCLGYSGLWGFNNGLGYSESRDWPELPSTGAAPPRYYLPELHLFVSPAVAQLIVDADPEFACPCPVCNREQENGRISLVSLSYHDLKRHFVLARHREIQLVASAAADAIAARLDDFVERFDNLRDTLPTRVPVDVAFLRRWSRILRVMS
jgi:hypothetical protein